MSQLIWMKMDQPRMLMVPILDLLVVDGACMRVFSYSDVVLNIFLRYLENIWEFLRYFRSSTPANGWFFLRLGIFIEHCTLCKDWRLCRDDLLRRRCLPMGAEACSHTVHNPCWCSSTLTTCDHMSRTPTKLLVQVSNLCMILEQSRHLVDLSYNSVYVGVLW